MQIRRFRRNVSVDGRNVSVDGRNVSVDGRNVSVDGWVTASCT